MARHRRRQGSDPSPAMPAAAASSSSSSSSSSSLRPAMASGLDSSPASEQQQPLLGPASTSGEHVATAAPAASSSASSGWLQSNQWIALALASGACAAFNGVFAKLHVLDLGHCFRPLFSSSFLLADDLPRTTTELTTRLSQAVAQAIGLDAAESAVEVVVRGVCVLSLSKGRGCPRLSVIFFFSRLADPFPRLSLHSTSCSTVWCVSHTLLSSPMAMPDQRQMWTLFTRALAVGHSATQVSIMNTSTNFVLTALLGFAIFSEALPPLWWAGATLLVAGNVIIGSKDEGKTGSDAAEAGSSLPEDEADEAAVAATTVSAAAATVGANKAVRSLVASASETPSRGRRSSRRLAGTNSAD